MLVHNDDEFQNVILVNWIRRVYSRWIVKFLIPFNDKTKLESVLIEPCDSILFLTLLHSINDVAQGTPSFSYLRNGPDFLINETM